MATSLGAPQFCSLEKCNVVWDLIIKVKYNGTLKYFDAHTNGSHFDHNLAALRSKIASAFKFDSDVEFILSYTDEDEDVVMLDDENDLRDAAINQKLNPLRINVQLKNSNIKAPRINHQAFNDLCSRDASYVSSLAELLNRLAALITPKGNVETSSGHVYCSSCSFSSGPQASRNTKIEHENELMTGSVSQSPDMQTGPVLKSVPEDPRAQVEQAPVCHLLDSLKCTSLGGKKSDAKGNTVIESKVRCASQSKEKSTTSSAMPHVSSSTYSATPIQHTPAPSVGENKLRNWPTYGYKEMVGSGMQFRGDRLVVPPYYRHLGSCGNINKDLQSSFATPATNTCNLPKLDIPSSVGTYAPSKDGLYPFSTLYKHNVPSSVSNNPEGRFPFGSSYNYGSIPQRALNKWIQCDGCGATSIVGPQYKSNIEDDNNLCVSCFSLMGNEFEYTRVDKTTSVNNGELLRCLQQWELKLECSFISHITIPDGTSMAPSNLFTKIWRLRNSGCAVWPFGTQVIWVGGDQFALHSSVKIVTSVNGVSMGQ